MASAALDGPPAVLSQVPVSTNQEAPNTQPIPIPKKPLKVMAFFRCVLFSTDWLITNSLVKYGWRLKVEVISDGITRRSQNFGSLAFEPEC
ncbi:hypothetical protein D3C78_1388390 [compost metagenome]